VGKGIIFVEKRPGPKKGGVMAENSCFGAKKGCVGHINFNLYHYAGNSPVKYTDPDGRKNVYFIFTFGEDNDKMLLSEIWSQFGNFTGSILSGVSAKMIIRGTRNDIVYKPFKILNVMP